MSQFLIVTGQPPSIDDITGLKLVPANQAQEYIAGVVQELFVAPDRDRTFLLDDGTLTSDEVVLEASDAIFENSRLEETRLGKALLRLLDADCVIRTWLASGNNSHQDLDVFRDRADFWDELASRLKRGNCGINMLYEPLS
ncbi:MAG: hypothetical protein V3T23_08720 [Nitrososphaerales archaeon]|nr:hypothetical protein [Nitrospinota bacterium]